MIVLTCFNRSLTIQPFIHHYPSTYPPYSTRWVFSHQPTVEVHDGLLGEEGSSMILDLFQERCRWQVRFVAHGTWGDTVPVDAGGRCVSWMPTFVCGIVWANFFSRTSNREYMHARACRQIFACFARRFDERRFSNNYN